MVHIINIHKLIFSPSAYMSNAEDGAQDTKKAGSPNEMKNEKRKNL